MTNEVRNFLEKLIGYTFQKKELLWEALTHGTFAHEAQDKKIKDNQRLEFLGDAVLGVVMSEFLYQTYPDYNEGELTKLKSYLVSAPVLSRQAGRLKLGSYMRLGKGEEFTGGRTHKSNLAAAFEAVLAAIYLDGGLTPVRKFILQELAEEIKLVQEGKSAQDYKSLLQELTLKKFGEIPAYSIISQSGPDHARTFKVEVKIKKDTYGNGKGSSRKAAEQAAAEEALKKMR